MPFPDPSYVLFMIRLHFLFDEHHGRRRETEREIGNVAFRKEYRWHRCASGVIGMGQAHGGQKFLGGTSVDYRDLRVRWRKREVIEIGV
jgi:hypothetical protein